MHRECRKCGQTKNLYEDYYKIRKNKEGPSAWSYECKVCCKARVKKEHEDDPSVKRNSHLKRKYGISLTDYNKILVEQNGVCATCGTDKPGGRWEMFACDHDHKTGQVRGLLCKGCNIALGEVGDNTQTLTRMVEYLNG